MGLNVVYNGEGYEYQVDNDGNVILEEEEDGWNPVAEFSQKTGKLEGACMGAVLGMKTTFCPSNASSQGCWSR